VTPCSRLTSPPTRRPTCHTPARRLSSDAARSTPVRSPPEESGGNAVGWAATPRDDAATNAKPRTSAGEQEPLAHRAARAASVIASSLLPIVASGELRGLRI
jgi:hypothetical protein